MITAAGHDYWVSVGWVTVGRTSPWQRTSITTPVALIKTPSHETTSDKYCTNNALDRYAFQGQMTRKIHREWRYTMHLSTDRETQITAKITVNADTLGHVALEGMG